MKWLKSFFTITYPKSALITLFCASFALWVILFFLTAQSPFLGTFAYILLCHAFAKAIFK